MPNHKFEHITNLILPALNSEKVVICDRFYDSTYAYQGIAHGLGLNNMIELKKLIIGDIEPTITFILDINPEIGLKRTSNREGNENRFENHIYLEIILNIIKTEMKINSNIIYSNKLSNTFKFQINSNKWCGVLP